jgi:hypothetical protein
VSWSRETQDTYTCTKCPPIGTTANDRSRSD